MGHVLRLKSVLVWAGVACVVAAALCRAQETAAIFPISGIVKDTLTGQPIARALVDGGTDATLTDSEGRFELHLPTGLAQLNVRRPGYSVMGRHSQHAVGVSAKTAEQTLYLTPAANITGHLTASNGGELANILVTAFRQTFRNGHEGWMQVSGSSANSEGTFRMYDLEAPAVYVLCTRSVGEPGKQIQAGASWGYPAVCYPANLGDPTVNLLHLGVGQQADVEIPIPRQPFYPVSVAVSRMPQGQLPAIQIHDQNGMPISYGVRWNQQRQVSEFELPNGSYYADVHTWGPVSGYGRVDFKVSNGPLPGLTLPVLPLTPLQVEIHKDFTVNQASQGTPALHGFGRMGATEETNALVNLILSPVDMSVDRGGGLMLEHPQSAAPGHFEAPNVTPGRYWVQASYFQNGYISSITSGGVDLLREPLVVGPGNTAEPIEITLRNDSGEIDCSPSAPPVEAADGQYSGNGVDQNTVCYAVPVGPRISSIQTAGTSAGAVARIENLAPGTYSVFALDEFRGLDALDAAMLAQLQAQGKTVTVAAGATVNVNVDLIKSSDEAPTP